MENSRNSHSTGGEISKSVGTGRGTCYWYSYWYRYFYQFWYFGRSSTRQAKFLYFQAFGTSIIADWVLGPVLVPVPAIPVHFGTGYRLLTPIPAYSPEEAKSSGEATSILSDDFMNRKQLNRFAKCIWRFQLHPTVNCTTETIFISTTGWGGYERIDQHCPIRCPKIRYWCVDMNERSLLIKQDPNMTK
jgi:hypothetical protein